MQLKKVFSYALHLVRQRPIGTPSETGASGEESLPAEEASPPESGILTFSRLVLPPLLLAPLVFAPVDMVTSLFWLLAGVCLLTSLVSVLVRLVSLAFHAAKRRSRAVALTRPLLTIAIVIGAGHAVGHSLYMAEHEAAELAASTQAEAKKTGTCPEVIPGWEVIPGSREGSDGRRNKRSRSRLGWTAHYDVVYETTEDRDAFTLTLRQNIDISTTFEGGSQTDLVATQSGGGHERTRLNLAELLRR